MKINYIILYITLLSFSAVAQESLLERRITCDFEKTTLEVVLTTLAKEHNIQFSYSKEQLTSTKEITLHVKNETLKNILSALGDRTGLQYHVIGQQVVIRKQNVSLPSASISISGKVVDASTQEPLPYASISIVGKSRGTVSNTNGEFEFYIPTSFLGDTLIISMVGYLSHKEVIKLDAGSLVIPLRIHTTMLDEVVVTDKSLTAREIMKLVKENIAKNYPIRKYQIEAFYRETKQENDQYLSLLEAALLIQDEGYHKLRVDEDVYIHEIRGSKRFFHNYNADFWNGENIMRGVLGLNPLRHPERQSDFYGKDADYIIEDVSFYKERLVYVLQSDSTENQYWKRRIFVDTKTYAVYRCEEIPVMGKPGWEVKDADSVWATMIEGMSIQEYKMHEGKLYLNFIKHGFKLQYYNPYTNKSIKTLSVVNELVVNDIHTTNLLPLDTERKMKNSSLQSQLANYNPEFWKHYNVIKKTPLEKKVLLELERESKLEDQFRESGQRKKK